MVATGHRSCRGQPVPAQRRCGGQGERRLARPSPGSPDAGETAGCPPPRGECGPESWDGGSGAQLPAGSQGHLAPQLPPGPSCRGGSWCPRAAAEGTPGRPCECWGKSRALQPTWSPPSPPSGTPTAQAGGHGHRTRRRPSSSTRGTPNGPSLSAAPGPGPPWSPTQGQGPRGMTQGPAPYLPLRRGCPEQPCVQQPPPPAPVALHRGRLAPHLCAQARAPPQGRGRLAKVPEGRKEMPWRASPQPGRTAPPLAPAAPSDGGGGCQPHVAHQAPCSLVPSHSFACSFICSFFLFGQGVVASGKAYSRILGARSLPCDLPRGGPGPQRAGPLLTTGSRFASHWVHSRPGPRSSPAGAGAAPVTSGRVPGSPVAPHPGGRAVTQRAPQWPAWPSPPGRGRQSHRVGGPSPENDRNRQMTSLSPE